MIFTSNLQAILNEYIAAYILAGAALVCAVALGAAMIRRWVR